MVGVGEAQVLTVVVTVAVTVTVLYSICPPPVAVGVALEDGAATGPKRFIR